jgi:hypothetical protein
MTLFLVFLIIVVVVGAVSYRAFAAAHGLTVMGNSWDLGDCGFALFRSGNRRYWRNVLRGQWRDPRRHSQGFATNSGAGEGKIRSPARGAGTAPASRGLTAMAGRRAFGADSGRGTLRLEIDPPLRRRRSC